MPAYRPPAHAQPTLRRGPAILTGAALIVLLIAALGALGVISVPDASGSSGGSPNRSSLAGGSGATSTPAASSTASVTAPPASTIAGAGVTQAPSSTVAAAGAPTRPNGFALAIGTFFDALAEPAQDAPTSDPVAPTIVRTTPPASVDPVALPAGSGTGKRVVYAINAQRVWLVEADGTVSRTYPVSGRLDRPGPGSYQVYSRSSTAVSYNYTETMQYMVRFAHGDRAAIGFHDIPVDQAGKEVQTVAQLGQPLSAGCVRQAEDDAIALWNWAPVGTTVVVLP